MKLIFLGTAQDGGIPQAGCGCPNCKIFRRNAASVALVDGNDAILIDITPDFRRQYRLLQEHYKTVLTAVYLTHAHWGHYGGLMQLGKEGWNTKGMPLYLSRDFLGFLERNEPFTTLLTSGNVIPNVLSDGDQTVQNIMPVPVYHRAEYSDTFAFIIDLNGKRVLYMPDVDTLDDNVEKLVRSVDIAIIDGTFFSKSEIGHRDIDQIPHPPVEESITVFGDIAERIIFTHINHTNPLLNRSSNACKKVIGIGFRIAEDGGEIS